MREWFAKVVYEDAGATNVIHVRALNEKEVVEHMQVMGYPKEEYHITMYRLEPIARIPRYRKEEKHS